MVAGCDCASDTWFEESGVDHLLAGALPLEAAGGGGVSVKVGVRDPVDLATDARVATRRWQMANRQMATVRWQ